MKHACQYQITSLHAERLIVIKITGSTIPALAWRGHGGFRLKTYQIKHHKNNWMGAAAIFRAEQ